MKKRPSLEPVEREFEGADLGHRSREKRLQRIVGRMSRKPGATLPDAMVSSADLEGLYKFLNTNAIDPEDLLSPHVERTLGRCEKRRDVLLLHDTTTFTFGGQSRRRGVGRVNDGGQGFFGHFCLATDRSGLPLGVVGLKTISRVKRKKKTKSKSMKSETRESLKWPELANEVHARVAERFAALHVMDSDADDYELFAALVSTQQRFVIRAAQNRNVDEDKGPKLFDVMEHARVRLQREVHLSERTPKETRSRSKRNQPRRERTAQLSISTRTVSLRRPAVCTSDVPSELRLNYVHVREIAPPEGEEPVDWLLVTNEPVRTVADVERVIDAYRCRWVIEEFFKALKTGCAFESLQLESIDALLRCLMLKIPMAWQLLLLRSLQWASPKEPSERALTEDQLTALRTLSEKPLPRKLTLLQALLAIAGLGGHIPSNGLPGWIVLGRGMERLNEATGFLIRLKASKKMDQS